MKTLVTTGRMLNLEGENLENVLVVEHGVNPFGGADLWTVWEADHGDHATIAYFTPIGVEAVGSFRLGAYTTRRNLPIQLERLAVGSDERIAAVREWYRMGAIEAQNIAEAALGFQLKPDAHGEFERR